jgi:hypothetical protein
MDLRRKRPQKIQQRVSTLRAPKARCCGAMPTPPNKSAGLEEWRNLGSEAALSERSEFSRFPKFSTADATRGAGRGSGGVGITP